LWCAAFGAPPQLPAVREAAGNSGRIKVDGVVGRRKCVSFTFWRLKKQFLTVMNNTIKKVSSQMLDCHIEELTKQHFNNKLSYRLIFMKLLSFYIVL